MNGPGEKMVVFEFFLPNFLKSQDTAMPSVLVVEWLYVFRSYLFLKLILDHISIAFSPVLSSHLQMSVYQFGSWHTCRKKAFPSIPSAFNQFVEMLQYPSPPKRRSEFGGKRNQPLTSDSRKVVSIQTSAAISRE